MFDYLLRLKSIVNSLIVINCFVSDKDLVILALNGILSEYHHFFTMITHGLTIISFGDMMSLLFMQEE